MAADRAAGTLSPPQGLSDELRRALSAKTLWALDLGEAVLDVQDGRGSPFAQLPLWITVSAWRPSARGPGGYFGADLGALDDCLGGTFARTWSVPRG
ncbi:hypothetical protein J7F03_27950 [Streptomyces sp. ISL-43]|uniref:hypothetical protein n=1 Tax=Streptomyces sp. ISL-43 TaxID=2819183 RepID=UPI001BEAE819|nr:hypothetical protein [Streptomyces sp. ISL-43]MBT2450839.1 hypothetical protein [Streptomyces sp. ISL-43]